jgi:hypothetical protein
MVLPRLDSVMLPAHWRGVDYPVVQHLPRADAAKKMPSQQSGIQISKGGIGLCRNSKH